MSTTPPFKIITCPACKERLRLRDDGTIPGHAKGTPSQRVACEAIGKSFFEENEIIPRVKPY